MLLLDVDPIKLVCGNRGVAPSLQRYVNDRPYVASSPLSVAIVAAFGTAMNGRSKERPECVVITTPNGEYNITWPTLPAGNFRHRDHRFEWTQAEFEAWVNRVAVENGYGVQIKDVGPASEMLGSPTQMALFDLSCVYKGRISRGTGR